MRNALALLLLLIASPALADPPPALSLDRAALVLTAQGASVNQGSPAFLPALGVSYSLTTQMSVIGDVGHDFEKGGTIERAGLRMKLANYGQGAVGLGVQYVGYQGAYQHPASWSASVHGDFPVARQSNGRVLLWLVTSAERDLRNDLSILRLGLRWQVAGGVPR